MNHEPVSACAVSDAMGRLGLNGVITGIAQRGTTTTLVGAAFPVRFVEGDGPFNQYLSEVPARAVVVLDAGGRADASAWGGLITREAKRLGIGGTVIHGACRDLAEITAIDYPVFARSATPRSGRGLISSAVVGEPLDIDGVAIAPGDVVVADEDGVVIVPSDRAGQVLQLARQITATDDALAEAVSGGEPLSDARIHLS